MEICNIVQEAVIKLSPRKRNAKRQNGCLRRPYKNKVSLFVQEEKRSEAKEEGKIYTSECRVPKKSKKRKESLLQ